jgi:hypothetical protein
LVPNSPGDVVSLVGCQLIVVNQGAGQLYVLGQNFVRWPFCSSQSESSIPRNALRAARLARVRRLRCARRRSVAVFDKAFRYSRMSSPRIPRGGRGFRRFVPGRSMGQQRTPLPSGPGALIAKLTKPQNLIELSNPAVAWARKCLHLKNHRPIPDRMLSGQREAPKPANVNGAS